MNILSFGNIDSSFKVSKKLISKILHTFRILVMRPSRVKFVPLLICYKHIILGAGCILNSVLIPLMCTCLERDALSYNTITFTRTSYFKWYSLSSKASGDDDGRDTKWVQLLLLLYMYANARVNKVLTRGSKS